MVVKLPHTEPMLGIPIKLSVTPGAVSTPSPAFGAHTSTILAELGYAAEEVQDFAEQGIIYVAPVISEK